MPRATLPRRSAKKGALPTGTLTFLFTDIEGSTLRWEEHGSEMSGALERHDAIVEHSVGAHDGVIFKKLGDGCCAVFSRAKDAVESALAAQQRLAQENFSTVGGVRVRMAIHTGETDEREGDYFGPALNRVARLAGIAQGGQVLLTAVTADLVKRQIGGEVTLRELGHFSLRDLAEPERVFQLCAPGLRDDFAPQHAAQVARHNLPTQLTRLVGREGESRELKDCIERHRLVTVSGSGGIGKTRLTVHAAAQLLDTFPDGVWIAELAPVTAAHFLPNAVAAVLNIHESPEGRLTTAIAGSIAHRSMLLILDNCEHLIEAAATFCAELLRAAPRLHIVTTSRQALGVGGEQLYRLLPLTYPPAGSTVTAQQAMEYSAVALFVERAQAVRQGFALTDETAPIVADICRRLDGIALAIELAAARVFVLSVARLNEGLKGRFRLLTGGRRDELPRHQTLRALIDWSYDLLNEQEQALFRRAGVFTGGFSWDSVGAICGQACGDALDVLDLLGSLVAKSLIVAQTEGDEERYVLLESSREYARDKLHENGELGTTARAHAEYFQAFAIKGDREFHAIPQAVWFAHMHREHENLRAALMWALDEGNDPLLGAEMAGSLERFWFEGGHLGEGLYWIDRALAVIDEVVAAEIAARLHLARAVLMQATKKLEAAERACELYRSVSDSRGLGHAQRQRALALRRARRWNEAESAGRAAAALLQEVGDVSGFAVAANTLGSIAACRGDFEQARALHSQALSAAQDHGGEYALVQTHMYLADLEFQCGDFAAAVAHAARGLTQSNTAGATRLAANLRCNLAIYRIALGDYVQGHGDALAALTMLKDMQDSHQTAIALQHVALFEALSGDAPKAARLCGYVDTYFAVNDNEREATEAWGRQSLERTLRSRLSDSEREALFAEGRLWDELRAVHEVLFSRHAAA